MKIIDVSEYQPNINYAEVAKSIDGVILRCGVTHWGTGNECVADKCFEKHYAGFKAAGVPVGAYYYSAADTVSKALEEAEFCKQLLTGKQLEMPVYIDVENSQRMEKLSKSQLTNQVEQWCESMEKSGYFVGVYANTDYFTRKLDVNHLSNLYTIWLADYRTEYNKTIPRDMHQYSSQGCVSGISGNVDMNNCTYDFPSVIKGAGLNGFDNQKPSNPGGSNQGGSVTTPESKDYIVQPGDSWWKIAAEQLGSGSRMGELLNANGATTETVIHPGQTIKIPGSASTQRTYTVRAGDSWWKIAAECLGSGTRMEELAATNGKTILDVIHPGDVLKLPN